MAGQDDAHVVRYFRARRASFADLCRMIRSALAGNLAKDLLLSKLGPPCLTTFEEFSRDAGRCRLPWVRSPGT